jgi:hypothetical protein
MYRRNLPHWYPDGTAIFLTWRLFGTLPDSACRILDGRGFRNADRELDRASSGPSWLSEGCVAGCAVDALRRAAMERQLCLLHAFVVMPNHVHVVLTPRAEVSRVTRWIKGVSAPPGKSGAGAYGSSLSGRMNPLITGCGASGSSTGSAGTSSRTRCKPGW